MQKTIRVMGARIMTSEVAQHSLLLQRHSLSREEFDRYIAHATHRAVQALAGLILDNALDQPEVSIVMKIGRRTTSIGNVVIAGAATEFADGQFHREHSRVRRFESAIREDTHDEESIYSR